MDVDAQPKSSEPLFLFDNDSDVEFFGADRDKETQAALVHATIEPTPGPEPNTSKPSRKSDAFDLEAYQREALARHQKELNKTRKSIVISDSGPTSSQPAKASDTQDSSTVKKTRQRPIKLDEGLLLSSKGFQQLIKNTKDFKIKGKGHEATDLNRLLQIYQFWTHQLHPRTQFRDSVLRIEKLCHSRRMLSALSVWRDEAHGIFDQDIQLSDHDHNEDLEEQSHVEVLPSSIDEVHPSSPSSLAGTHPPTSDVESEPSNAVDEIPDDDMDALIQEYSKQSHEAILDDDPSVLDDYFTLAAPPPPVSNTDIPMADAMEGSVMAEDEEDWNDMYI